MKAELYILTQPSLIKDFAFEDLPNEFGLLSDDWEEKAADLQDRRWRKINKAQGFKERLQPQFSH